MSGTILVKSPVIPQWWNITVTAPSVTNIPSGFYDGTETITANVGYVWVEYSWNTSMNVFWWFEAGRYGNSSSWFWTSPIDWVIYDDWTYIYILHCSAVFWTLSWSDFQITWALHCIRVDKISWATNIYSSKQFFTWVWSSSTGNNRLFYVSWWVISVYSQTSSSYENLCELDLSTMLFTQWWATWSWEPRFNKQLWWMLTDALWTLWSWSPVWTQIVTTSWVAWWSTYTLISVSWQSWRWFAYTRWANKTP